QDAINELISMRVAEALEAYDAAKNPETKPEMENEQQDHNVKANVNNGNSNGNENRNPNVKNGEIVNPQLLLPLKGPRLGIRREILAMSVEDKGIIEMSVPS
nr:hypothetical protein [Tanacetum cinerariifolium]